MELSEKDWQDILRKDGISAVVAKKRELDNKWRTIRVLIAVIGQTGSGKSTLIGRMLGYSPDDPRSPTVREGVKVGTKEAAEYTKKDSGLIYIDLPGVASTTKTCDISTTEQMQAYAECHRLEKMDYFILVSQNKFNNEEKQLAAYITRVLKKNYVFVQTKMDLLRGEHKHKVLENKNGFVAVKNLIRAQIQSELRCSTTDRIFLIANNTCEMKSKGQQHWVYEQSSDYEFDGLMNKILKDMSGESGLAASKENAFLFATGATSRSAIHATANSLRNQRWGWSTLSGMIGAVPIPGVSLTCDSAIVLKVASEYFRTFGLDPASYITGDNPVERLKSLVDVMRAGMGARAAALLTTVISASLFEEGIKSIPAIGVIVGTAVGATTSFASTSVILYHLVDFCEQEALKMMQTN